MSNITSRPLALASILLVVAVPKCVREPRAHVGGGEPRQGTMSAAAAAELTSADITSAEVTPADLGQILTIDVPADRDVLLVPGNPSVRRPIVHLHGMCAEPRDDLTQYGTSVAKEHGTILALMGDVPCPDKPGRLKWSEDTAKHDARIVAAISAANDVRGSALRTDDVLLVGESMGAARAEALAAASPERYGRLVLVGSPRTPSPDRLKGVRAVANVAGEHEDQTMMKEGARLLTSAGTPAQFWELPGASHGEYGSEGPRVMGEALAFAMTR